MTTPTSFSVPDLEPHAITAALNQEAQRQHEATPPFEFASLAPVPPYDYLCEIEHDKYSAQEVDKIRRQIADGQYWELEARMWCAEYSKRIWELSLEKHSRDEVSRTKVMRTMALEYIRRLNRKGVTMGQVRTKRHLVEDQAYWKSEWECFGQASAEEEKIMLDHFVKRKQFGHDRAQRQRRVPSGIARERRREARVSKQATARSKDSSSRQLRRRVT